MYNVFLSLGSNLGDRENNLIEAVKRINEIDEVKITKISNIYETEPVGYLDQGRFLNMALKLQTVLTPLKLLKELQNIENLLKRTREIYWGPRTIDIDILMIDDLKINLEDLVVPHPRMFERAFVLVPLMDIIDKENVVIDSINGYIDKCTDKNGVKIYKKFEKAIGDVSYFLENI